MKKLRIFTTVLLVICLTLSMMLITSCGENDDKQEKGAIDKFADAIAATTPSAITGDVTMTADFGTMNMEYSAQTAADGSFTLNYSYDRFNGIEEGGASDTASKVTGTVTYANGTYTGDTNVGKIPANAVASKLNVKSDKIDAEISNDEKILTATVKAADTKEVFGVEYASDITMSLTMQDGKIASLTLAYTYEGASVSVLCTYK